ncbi:MAG TPA: ABC transporter substrate-binding protein [Chloroflexota bacterium]|nr:ABC transporter substrate-binding protein [Chloroflexota bacterium]
MSASSSRRVSRRGFLRGAGVAAGGAWLASCAPTGGSSSAPPAKTASGGAAPTAAPAAAAAKPAGGSPIKIGLLQPYSGVYAALGESTTNAVQMYLDSVGNSAGGRAITIIKEDEGSAPDEALRKARKLVEQDQVDIVAGPVSSANALAIRDLFHDTKNLLIVTTAGANDITRARKSPYIFRASYGNFQVHYPMGQYLYNKVGHRFMLTAADYAAGREVAAAFKQGFQEAGGELVGEIYPPFPNTDYAAYLTQIAQARPDATFSFYAGSDAVNFVKQYAEFGLSRDVKLTGSGFMLEQDTLPAQGQAALGGITALHWALTLDTPENKAFVDAYRQKFNKDPDVYAVHGYDTARIIVEALNQTQGDASNKDRLIEAIAGVKFTSPRGSFEFDPETHNVVHSVYVREVRDVGGKLTNVVLDTFPPQRDRG